MQPLYLLRHLRRDMIDYVSSKYPFFERGYDDLHSQLVKLMSREGLLFQDPVLQLVRQRRSGTFDSSLFSEALRPKVMARPYQHQINAWKRLIEGKPTVVATGTGSGKSECFMFPIVDGLLKAGFTTGPTKVGALCLYPMNALVEDQFFRFLKLTAGTGLKVGIYNGTYNQLSKKSREKILAKAKKAGVSIDEKTFFVNPEVSESVPHILLTNFKMLEYMLLRTRDHALFRGADLKYLVLDEAHTYTGTLGLEIACLIGRLRVHLEGGADKFVPIATSATLVQRGKEDASQEVHQHQMSQFFSQLFGTEFPSKDGWLIEDDFEPLPKREPSAFSALKAIPASHIGDALTKDFPDLLITLGKLLFNIELPVPHGVGSVEDFYDAWGKALFPALSPLAPQLASTLLVSDNGSEDKVVSWTHALKRWCDRTGAEREHLEALLMLASQAYTHRPFPALGVRVHVFGRAEPRVYWTLDQKKLLSEGEMLDSKKTAAAFVNCRKCGHMAWAGLYVPSSAHQGQGGVLDPLPPFFEDSQLTGGAELVVLHRPEDVQEEVTERKSWSKEEFEVDFEGGTRAIRFVAKGKKTGSAGAVSLVRVRRKTDEGGFASDISSCPACGGTSTEDRRPILLSPRSGAATDISVYSASAMTHIDIATERKLLIFCDNRQETAFLAGFLSDRHRRFNLRRAAASFLKEAQEKGQPQEWKFLADINEEERPGGHRFDFAARLLLSLHHKQYWGKEPLPDRLEISRQLLLEIIPRDALEVGFRDRFNPGQEATNEYKNWLLGNVSLSADSDNAEKNAFETVELFNTDKGKWCLRTLHEVVLLEISAMVGREGNLRALGLVSWSFPGLSLDRFESYTKTHPDLGIGALGLFIICHWLMEKLAENGQWQELDPSTRRHILGRRGKTEFDTLKDTLGKGFADKKGISKNSAIGRLLFHFGGDDALKTWSQQRPWEELIVSGPLEDVVALSKQDGFPRLKTAKATVLGAPVRYRGKISGTTVSVSRVVPLQSQPTGRKDDFWERHEEKLHDYYRVLYQRSFSEEARLVRAHEHNGMLGGDIASEVIQYFENHIINTLVATPTLEMGVDLPDLPIVIHRSVPPDASNYAQRAGRAGRDTKRALIVTHCGFGSHDLTFYQDPKQMVSGEILPPGLPTENLSILKRHINGLVLELLAKELPTTEALNFSWWGDLVDLNELREQVLSVGGSAENFPESSPKDWRSFLNHRREYISQGIARFVEIIERGLWKNVQQEKKDLLARQLAGFGDAAAWAQAFQREVDGYLERAKLHVEELLKSLKQNLGLDASQRREIERQVNTNLRLVEMYLSRSDRNYPLSYLGTSGFLPNFDFPGKSIQFVGVLPQFMDKNATKYARLEDKYLTFTRGAAVALREFAPEQKVYGQGFVYRVDRYEAAQNPSESENAWGVCTNGCTQLSKPGAEVCDFCQGELVYGGEQKDNRPNLIEIQAVQGVQDQVISDRETKRTFNRMVKEVRHLGIPSSDETYSLESTPEIGWSLHLSPQNQITVVTLLSGSVLKISEGQQQVRITPVYREAGDAQSKIFRVKASAPSEDEKNIYEPFLPAVWGKGQALLFRAPFAVAQRKQWITADPTDLSILDRYYKTLAQLLSRSATRVLRLNKRKASLQFIDHVINQPAENGEYRPRERALLILDAEEGGSGVIPLIWDYWDAIMHEAEQLVRKGCCRSACYECLKSYDNQYEHSALDKSLFMVGDSESIQVPTFTALRKFHQQKPQYVHSEASNKLEVDEKSPAESVLEEYLRQNFTLEKATQETFQSILGRVITISDFSVSSGAGDRVAIFVDGWEHHREVIARDMQKRNSLARQGLRVVHLPAGLLVPKLKQDILKPIINAITRQDRIVLPKTGKPVVNVPSPKDGKLLRNLPSRCKPDGWEEIKPSELLSHLSREIGEGSAALLKYLSKVDASHFPLGEQKGFLLWPVYGDYLAKPENYQLWGCVLTLQGTLAALGYINLLLDISGEPKLNVVAA